MSRRNVDHKNKKNVSKKSTQARKKSKSCSRSINKLGRSKSRGYNGSGKNYKSDVFNKKYSEPLRTSTIFVQPRTHKVKIKQKKRNKSVKKEVSSEDLIFEFEKGLKLKMLF